MYVLYLFIYYSNPYLIAVTDINSGKVKKKKKRRRSGKILPIVYRVGFMIS